MDECVGVVEAALRIQAHAGEAYFARSVAGNIEGLAVLTLRGAEDFHSNFLFLARFSRLLLVHSTSMFVDK